MNKVGVYLILGAVLATGQTITSSIVGAVVDSSDLPVVGAKLVLKQAATGIERRAETDALGNFVLSNLEPGRYTLTVEVPGFKRLERTDLILSPAERLSVGKLVLEVGNLVETVTVTAQGALVQTASSERSGLIASDQIQNLLTRSRNIMSLLSLLPGVVDINDGAVDSLTRTFSIFVQGNRRTANSISMDGMVLNAWGLGWAYDVAISQDAVAEVKVLLGNYQAEYGRRSGANIVLIGKSGTQQFHGLFSYFKRHEQFNANDFFRNRTSQPKARYRYHTWTYNIGGPVYIPGRFNNDKDKLFFFWNQEFWPQESVLTGRVTVPTDLERAGNFSQSLDLNNALIPVYDPFANKQPFPGNIIPPSRVNSDGQALLKVFDPPNFLDRNISKGNYNYVFDTPVSKPHRMTTLRLDSNISSNHRVSFSYHDYYNKQTGKMGLDTGGSNWPQFEKGYFFRGQSFVARHTWIISPTLISEASAGFSRRPQKNTVIQEALRRNQRDTVGFKAGQFYPQNNPLNIIPNAYFGGVPNAAYLYQEGRFPFFQNAHIPSFTWTLTKTLTGHTVKGGITGDFVRYHTNTSPLIFGQFNFDRNTVNPLDTNYAYANAILGVFSTYQEASFRPMNRGRQVAIEWFAQDSWKATRRLTLEYGMRFHWIGPMWDAKDMLATFTFEKFDAARQVRLVEPVLVGGVRRGHNPVTGEYLPESTIGAIASGSGDPFNGMLLVKDNPGYPRGLYEHRGVHLGPRFGFAWDVFGNGQTALRGGWGMYYNHPGWYVYYEFASLPPLVVTPTVYYGQISTLLSSAGVLFPQSVLAADRHSKTPSTMNASLSIQQKLPFGTVLDIAYSNSLSRNLFWQRQLNPVPLGRRFDPAYQDPTRPGTALPTAFLTPIRGYTSIVQKEAAASSNYHSLQVTANRRFAKGLQFGASWTWSKAMDYVDYDESGAIAPFVSARVWHYGPAEFDRTHVLKLNWIWDIPKTPWRNRLLKGVFNDWQLSGIASFISGTPLGIGWSSVTGVDVTGTPSLNARVVVTGNPVLPKSERTFSRNFRTDVFQMPAVGTLGNAPKVLIRGPGINNWDLALFKNFPIRERARIQFRWEAYNAFNHTQFSALDTTARFDAQGRQVNARFGEFTASRSPRIMQLAARFEF